MNHDIHPLADSGYLHAARRDGVLAPPHDVDTVTDVAGCARRLGAALLAAALLSVSALASAQTPPTPPARETPRPQDIDPAVDTSAVPTNGAGDANSASPTEAAPPARPAPSTVRPSGVTTSPAGASSSTRPANPAAGASAGATTPPRATPGTASPNTAASPNNPATAAPNAAKPKSRGQDRLELDTTQITGNRELPKVLYIVPWKRADLGDLVGKPVNSLLDEVLAPVDRDVFKRENRYYRALTPAADGQPAGANPAPASSTAPNGATSSGSAAPPARDER